MELAPSDLEDGFLEELLKTRTEECLHRFLDAQRDLFRCQVDQLQKIVVHQCKVTGVNPLSQEMAAGALSINIGKKPRDLLNPKAIYYMQSVFALKDSISKKESREISALCGVTITQVREYFASQRSRVRKFVRLSREKAIKFSESNETSTDCPLLLDSDPTAINGLHLNHGSVTEEETLPGLDADDKTFLDQIFGLMKRENTFSGQMKLIEWILQIHTSAVLQWFLAKGGVSILASWLSEAAVEEQTSVILAIFKVLCHLPLHKALPAQMSAILQTVNKLRFYRTSDISSKARVLLSRWSKLFIRSQATKRPPSVKYPLESQKEIIRRQRISEILSDGSWPCKDDLPEDILALGYEGSDSNRKLDSKRVIKMLPATSNESSKKLALSSSCPKTKEKRKVLLVEQPDRRNSGRNVQVARAVPMKGSRPMSSDDIQKAKMHAIFMQRKYGSPDASSNASDDSKFSKLAEFEKDRDEKPTMEELVDAKPLTSVGLKSLIESESPASIKLPSAPESTSLTSTGSTSLSDSKTLSANVSVPSLLDPIDSKPWISFSLPSAIDSKPTTSTGLVNSWSTKLTSQPSSEKPRRDQLMWRTPPVIRINELWRVGSGESSKEMDVQTARIRREQAVVYGGAAIPPPNPKEPWDLEMDFDDSLTPEIPTEPPPDADATVDSPPVATQPPATAASAEPDLELLAVLLKNPELVFALTSGQGSGLSNAETVALLDVIKRSTGGDSIGASSAEPVLPTSLPSPTPSSERENSGIEWKLETAPPVAAAMTKNPSPVTQHHHLELSQTHQHHHHRHHLIPHSMAFSVEPAAAALSPLLPPPRAQSPILGRWPNGPLESPIPRATEQEAARLQMSAPPIAAVAGAAAYLDRAELGEAWSPERSYALPERSRLPPHTSGRVWLDRNRR